MIIGGPGIFGFKIMEGMTWGVGDLSIKERIQKVIEAGVDQFGGNSNTEELVELIEEGRISEGRIDESARRLLRAKFQMGLFDNPFVDIEKAVKTVGRADFVEKGKLAQRKSIVMLKNNMLPDSSFVLPLGGKQKVYVENFDKAVAGQYATVVDRLVDADFAILRLHTPWVPRTGASFFENFFHQGDMDFKEPEWSCRFIRRIWCK
jgi:beta-glucosidase